MNKAQDYLEKVKRHQFWILCGLVAVVSIVSWWLATRSLADTYSKNKTKIESEAGKITSVKGIDPHPNENWNEGISKLVKDEKEEVKKAWQRLYQEQKSKVYVWPVDVLLQDFVDAVENLQPGQELPTELLNRYWNDVLKQFRQLAQLIDAEYQDPTVAVSGFGDRGAAAVTQLLPGQMPHRVIWYGQAELQQPYMWADRPTTQQVLYAQEEIWVIKAICEAIAKANEGSAGAHDAAVRTIEDMAVGYAAAEEHPNGMKEPGRITKLRAPVAATGGYGSSEGGPSAGGDSALVGGGGLIRPPRPDMAGGGRSAGYGSSGYGGVSSESSAAVASTNPDDYLKEWRYVDGNSTPLSATALATPPFYEYRLMPWRVRMTVDQRKWDELLVMFRNTDLPLAIRQVRVNPSDSFGTGGGPGRGFESRGGYGAAGAKGYGAAGYGATGRGGYGAGESRDSPGTDRNRPIAGFGSTNQTDDQTLTLELRGVAYLINPPDFSKIGVAGTTTPVADMSAPAAAVSATPPADPFGAAPATPAAVPAPVPAPRPVGRPGYGSGR